MPKKITDAVEEVVDDIIQEVNEPVGVVTFNRWHLALAATVITVFLLVIIL